MADRRKDFGALRAGDEYLFCYLARGSSKQYTELQVLSSSSVPTEKAAEIYQQNISVRMSESVGFGPGRRSCDGDDASKAYLDLNHVRRKALPLDAGPSRRVSGSAEARLRLRFSFVAAPARSQNGGRLPYQRVCAFRYAVVLLQLSLECRERCLQQRQDLPSLVSRRLPWRQLIFRFQQPTLEFTRFGLELLVLLFRGRHPLKLRSFEHTDLHWAPFNEPSHILMISHQIQHGIDLFDRENHEFTLQDALARLPRALTEYPDRFLPLFLPGYSESLQGDPLGVWDRLHTALMNRNSE